MISGPLKYFGGKSYLAKKHQKIAPPWGSYVNRIHAFAGGLGEFWNWDYIGISEIINDRNRSLTNFWRVLQSKTAFEDFRRIIEAMPFSEVEWDDASLRATAPADPKILDVDAAIAFFVLYRQSRQGLAEGFATISRSRVRRDMNEQTSAWITAVEGLPEAHERLNRVVIMDKCAIELIQQQDDPLTFYYLDPPYLHETRVTTDGYEHEMTWDEHSKLLEVLHGIKGKFMLCGYRSGLYDLWATESGWNVHEFSIDNKSSSKKEKDIKIECVYTNY